jgi:hypothetical protein
MSDRSYTAITVYACPEQQRVAVLAAIEEHLGIQIEPGETLQLGERYDVEELVLGYDEPLATALAEISPDICFDLQQEPKYEFLGSRHIQVPGLGLTSFSCSSEGEPFVSWDVLDTVLEENQAQRVDQVRERIAALFARPHIEGLDYFRKEDS